MQQLQDELQRKQENFQALNTMLIQNEDYLNRSADFLVAEQRIRDMSDADLQNPALFRNATPIEALLRSQQSLMRSIMHLTQEVSHYRAPDAAAVDEAAPAPPEEVGKWSRFGRWVSKKAKAFVNFFKTSSSEETVETTTVQPQQQQVRAPVADPYVPDPPGVLTMQQNLSMLYTTVVDSRTHEVRKPAYGPDEPEFQADKRYLTDSKMKKMQEHGARATDGNFLAVHSQPALVPIRMEMKEMSIALDEDGFDYMTAVQGTTQKADLFVLNSITAVSTSPAIATLVAKSLQSLLHHLDEEGYQDYVRTIYEAAGKDLVDYSVKNTSITEADIDDHVLRVLPTRGMAPFLPAMSHRPEGMSEEQLKARHTFYLQADKMYAGFSSLLKLPPDKVPETIQPIMHLIQALRDKLSAIGKDMCRERLEVLRQDHTIARADMLRR